MLQLLGRVLFGAIDGVLAVLEAGSKTYDRGKKLAGVFKKKPAPEETPVPLTYRSVQNQYDQIRSATEHRDAIRPPPARGGR